MSVRFPRPIAIDLFSGAGGLSEGLRQAGFDPKVAVDFDPHSLSSYQVNHPETVTVLSDIQNVTGASLQALAGTDEIDLVAGGPSCQGFSTHGKRLQDDPRNFLFKHFVRIVSEIQPKMFLMENVKGMLTYSKGYFREQIEDAFREIGYRTAFATVCAADYGVPQLRNRVLFIGTRLDGVSLRFPEKTHGPGRIGMEPYVTVSQALNDLPLIGQNFNAEWREYAGSPSNAYQRYARSQAHPRMVSLQTGRPLSAQAQRIANHVKQGEGLRAVPADNLPDRFKRMRRISNGSLRQDCTTLYHRLHPDRPSYTITCYYRNVASGPFLHPWEDRALSHREAARLMSFPDSYVFKGSQIARQIGNAVPVLMARAIGLSILESLNEAEALYPQRSAAD